MPMNGRMAYPNQLSPVSLGPGEETDLPYQDADGDLSGDPMGHEALGDEGGEDNLQQLLALLGPDALSQEAPPDEEEPPPALDDDIAQEGEEGFPTGMGPGNGQMMMMAQKLLGGFHGKLG